MERSANLNPIGFPVATDSFGTFVADWTHPPQRVDGVALIGE